ncbi:MAG: CPBP family intramembrane metalloprotease [Clostridia bacterium]|nr:CPBP family intramembrane metalloprotease [Clostridia bacterium]
MSKKNFKIEKGNTYSVLDAFKFFFFLVVTYFGATLVYMMIVSIVAGSKGMSSSELYATETCQALSFVLPPVVFISFFLIYNKVKKIKCKYAFSDGQPISLLPISVAIVLAIISIFLFTPIVNLIEYGFMELGYYADNTIPLQGKMQSSLGYFALGLLIYALLPAIAEEIVFRGVIQNAIMSKFNGFVAIFFSTILFVLMHGSLQQTAYQLIVGIMLGYLACVGGSIVYSIILHFLSNALVLVFSCFDIVSYLNGQNMVYYNFYSMVFPICIFLLGVALVGILFWVLKYLRNKNFFRYDVKMSRKKKSQKVDEPEEEPKKLGLKGMWQALAYNERVFMIACFVLIGCIWLINTISGFAG